MTRQQQTRTEHMADVAEHAAERVAGNIGLAAFSRLAVPLLTAGLIAAIGLLLALDRRMALQEATVQTMREDQATTRHLVAEVAALNARVDALIRAVERFEQRNSASTPRGI